MVIRPSPSPAWLSCSEVEALPVRHMVELVLPSLERRECWEPASPPPAPSPAGGVKGGVPAPPRAEVRESRVEVFEEVDVFEALLDACPSPSAAALPLLQTGEIRGGEGGGARAPARGDAGVAGGGF